MQSLLSVCGGLGTISIVSSQCLVDGLIVYLRTILIAVELLPLGVDAGDASISHVFSQY